MSKVFASSSYNLRGWLSILGLLIILMGYLFAFSGTTLFISSVIFFFLGGDLFLRNAYREVASSQIGFNFFITLNALALLIFPITNNLLGPVGYKISGLFLLVPLTFCFANFLKAKEVSNISYSFNFISSLDNFISKSAILVEGEKQTKVFTSEIKAGQKILINVAQRVPLDCIILEGTTLADEHLLTGNITLAAKEPGDLLLAGSINKGGPVIAEVKSSIKSSKLARVLNALKISEQKKISAKSFLDLYSYFMVLCFVSFAFIYAFLSVYVLKDKTLLEAFNSFVFILALSGPVIYMACLLLPLRYMKKGALNNKITMNNPNALEMIKKSDIIYIDKTGTLTTGNLEVDQILPAKGYSEEEVALAAATSQQGSTTIFAKALKEYCRTNKIVPEPIISTELHPSYGTIVRTQKDIIFAGRKAWLEGKGIKVELASNTQELRKTIFYLSKNNKFMGCVCFTDKLRANVKSVVSYLQEQGKELCLLSGDNTPALQIVANRAGIKNYIGDMYPRDKAARIAATNNLGKKTTMIGDSFNDILALLEASGAIAFAREDSPFISWVDIVLQTRDFGAVRKIFDIYGKMHSIMKQNILLALVIGIGLFFFLTQADKIISWYQFIFCLFVSLFIIFINSVRLKYE
ncbi:MAG: HAD-IC family P-type ATPase [Elusimicrobiaceae bacterium]|nr:HAD-IC family P-type ATPase [Elusimicrobiaceae bacterium]